MNTDRAQIARLPEYGNASIKAVAWAHIARLPADERQDAIDFFQREHNAALLAERKGEGHD